MAIYPWNNKKRRKKGTMPLRDPGRLPPQVGPMPVYPGGQTPFGGPMPRGMPFDPGGQIPFGGPTPRAVPGMQGPVSYATGGAAPTMFDPGRTVPTMFGPMDVSGGGQALPPTSFEQAQQQAQQQWGGLSPEQQAQAGGYFEPAAGKTGIQGDYETLSQRWVPYRGAGAGGVGGVAAGGAPGAAGGQYALGGAEYGVAAPQFYGMAPEGYGALEEQLFQEQMAGVSGEFGRRGLASSSMFGQAAVTARAGAQRTRYGLEAAEQQARTSHERAVAFERWRLGGQRAQQAQQAQQARWQEARLRAAQEQQFRQYIGQLEWQSAGRILDRRLGAIGPGRAPSTEQVMQGQAQQAQGSGQQYPGVGGSPLSRIAPPGYAQERERMFQAEPAGIRGGVSGGYQPFQWEAGGQPATAPPPGTPEYDEWFRRRMG